MRRLAASGSYAIPFSTSTAPDALPTATVYADATSLGSATVSTAPGTNAYSVAVVLPSNVTAGQVITVAINWAVDSVAQSTARLLVGQVLAAEPTAEQIAAAVLAAAADNPIRADMRLINGNTAVPASDVAKESSVQGVLEAVNGLDGPGAPTGPGGIPVVIPVTSNNQPVDGAAVWITTDPEGTNQIAGVIHTDTFGNTNPAFTLEAGIFYVWVQKAGINFPNPQAIEVLENGTYQWYTN